MCNPDSYRDAEVQMCNFLDEAESKKPKAFHLLPFRFWLSAFSFLPKQNYLCPMRFDIITVLPALLESPFAHSILQRAQKKGISEIVVHNLREYATNKHKSVDDYP